MERVNPDNLIADDFGKPDPEGCCDPITGAGHFHPVGTGVGAAVGASVGGIAAAAAIGAGLSGPAAPIGGVIGAVVAAIVGAAAGHTMAEHYEGSDEDLYWRENYATRPYYEHGSAYEHYAPAYQYGWEAQRHFAGKDFQEVESHLGQHWEHVKGQSTLDWERARQAARDAWERVRGGGQGMGTPVRARDQGMIENPGQAEPLTSADVVKTPGDSSFVQTTESQAVAGRDLADTDVSRTNPDLADTKVMPGIRDENNPDDATSRSIRGATKDAADRAGI
jgi:hypothetical protein